uniref:Uncharacterized protein n=1 Tax=Kalanchoe fedtschenkoi TaxID=63787 RepID=A0A7N0RBJ7_KALFE
MYRTTTLDSHTALESWMSTGIFLCTGFVFSRSSLLFSRSSSLYSNSTPFSLSAILTLMPNALAHVSSRTTPSAIDGASGRKWGAESG